MTKYYVDDVKGNRIYEGFDEDEAYRTCRSYNDAIGGTYAVHEHDTDLDEFEKVDENTYVFYNNEYLTALYGDDEHIKENIWMAIEYETGREVINFDLSYNDPGDSGDNATFWARNIKWEPVKKCVKDCTINEIFNYILKQFKPGTDIAGVNIAADQGVSVYYATKTGKQKQFHLGPNKKIEIEEE